MWFSQSLLSQLIDPNQMISNGIGANLSHLTMFQLLPLVSHFRFNFPHCFIYKIYTVYMHLNTLPMVSIYLWQHSKHSCWPAQSHTEFWWNSMQLNFRIVHLRERTSKFCFFTNCFKMAEISCFMGPLKYLCSNQIFETHVFWVKLHLDTFETKVNPIKLILLFYNIIVCIFSSLYLFE